MARIVLHERNHPYVVKLGELPGFKNLTADEKVLNYEIHMCACGLSKNKPFCDGSHAKTKNEEEKKLYSYDEQNQQHVVDPKYV